MTATEELRRLLDELRNLASDVNEAEIRSHSVINLIQGPYNRRFVLDMNHDWLNAWHAEFERILQAIAATLGSGTCRRVRGHRSYRTQGGYRIECSECGYGLADRRYNFCPNCGRRIVEVGE